LAQAGRSVVVLESHTQLGGLTHTFARKKVRWGTGLHYTGWPTAYFNDFPILWEKLTRGNAPWVALPDEADYYVRSDGTSFLKRGGRDSFREDLLAEFPKERQAIDRYFDDMRRMLADYLRFMTLQAIPPVVERCGLGWWLGRRFLREDRVSVVEYMDRIGASERLREHLWFTWGNFGGIPSETSIGAYSVPMEFMMDGLKTIDHGSRTVAEAFAATITAHGGELRRGARVDRIVFRNGRAAGVQVGDETIRAKTVISGIGARETYGKLIPEESRPGHAARITAMRPSCSIFTLYLALKRTAFDRFGLHGVNYWVESEAGSMRTYWDDLSRTPGWFLLSLASRFQQHAATDLIPAEVFVGIPGEVFSKWQETRVMKRGEEYDTFKADLIGKVLQRVEQTWPGFASEVQFLEGASPATIQSYTGHLQGAAYGIAPVPGRYSDRKLRIETGVPGLLLTGQDVSAAGVIGAFYGGITAASCVLKRNAASRLLNS
ncbi:MAG: NAD(P)/FAD-dependent oxidoreductase, partial [Planctomycetaceae bacterium]|nr:NAD(P)/FAD-dependent oxidoreductase [Planctomycetaceae bacterium]